MYPKIDMLENIYNLAQEFCLSKTVVRAFLYLHSLCMLSVKALAAHQHDKNPSLMSHKLADLAEISFSMPPIGDFSHFCGPVFCLKFLAFMSLPRGMFIK